jgi:uncharacterized membrane-anchored protein YjiN (DUF445 family)
MQEYAQVATPFQLPCTLRGCRERVITLQDEIASIRIQIATTDIRRQTDKKSLDAAWFHRAKTALRLKQQEMSQLTEHIAKLNAHQPNNQRERFKDALIEVLRSDCDDEKWTSAVNRARALHAAQELPHG